MRLTIFGGLRVLGGEQALELGGPKQRAVLAVLALHLNQVVSVDRLVDDLWGDELPPRRPSRSRRTSPTFGGCWSRNGRPANRPASS
jgi:DNA-binding SARP family transcriptional activator